MSDPILETLNQSQRLWCATQPARGTTEVMSPLSPHSPSPHGAGCERPKSGTSSLRVPPHLPSMPPGETSRPPFPKKIPKKGPGGSGRLSPKSRGRRAGSGSPPSGALRGSLPGPPQLEGRGKEAAERCRCPGGNKFPPAGGQEADKGRPPAAGTAGR